VSFIDRHATQPFFLYLAYNAPHSPYQASQSYLDRVANISDPNRRTYAAMITALDDGVGKVVQALSANNLTEKTLIFFLSDNGAQIRFHRSAPSWLETRYLGRDPGAFAIRWTGHCRQVVYGDPVSSLTLSPPH
jgi:arylsulfatase A-like enzyme